MEKYSDKALGISANQYSGAVVFIQNIKLKAKAKTKITGTVEYQTCDDKNAFPKNHTIQHWPEIEQVYFI